MGTQGNSRNNDDEALRRLEEGLPPAPDFENMSDAEREAWLKSRPSLPLPTFARPILVAAILSFLWFVIFSPLLSASWGPNLSPDVLDRGQANVRSCERNWTTLWRMWECEAETTWQGGSPRDAVVMSPRELSGPTEVVARDKLRNGRATKATDFGKRTVVVPADMPANTFGSVMSMTFLNVGAMLVVWVGAGIAVSILAKRP